ncbi:DUF4864 domain-containing protein [soil metagenome]
MPYQLNRRVLLSVATAASLIQGSAVAAGLADAEAKEVRATVQAQLKAFAADDARRAFSFAAPNVHEMFGTPDNFMAMVKSAYPMVHRPSSVAFLKAELQDTGEVLQRVQILDGAGDSWLATYALDRQKDKSWRITGCAVVQNKGRVA